MQLWTLWTSRCVPLALWIPRSVRHQPGRIDSAGISGTSNGYPHFHSAFCFFGFFNF
jgi:hypothetical protein